MQKAGVRVDLKTRVEAIIEVARLLVKSGHSIQFIQKTLIDPLLEEVDVRIEHGPGPKE